METTKEWEGRIIEALKMQHKKYLQAIEHHDGYGQCKAIGAVRIHAARLNTEYNLSLAQIHELLFQAGEEYRKEKAGRIGRQ